MSDRVFQVSIRGEFADLAATQRAALSADLPNHDLYQSKFTEAGNLTYDETLRSFTLRFLVTQSADAPDSDAEVAAELLAHDYLGAAGLLYRRLRASSTCLTDLKINRRK